jgi:hypothetical protein
MALKQHIWDSPPHAHSYDCKTCNRLFINEIAHKQHIWDSLTHVLICDTPLDIFFQSY